MLNYIQKIKGSYVMNIYGEYEKYLELILQKSKETGRTMPHGQRTLAKL